MNGENAVPLYKYLTENTTFVGFSGPMGLILKGVVKKMDKDAERMKTTKRPPLLKRLEEKGVCRKAPFDRG